MNASMDLEFQILSSNGPSVVDSKKKGNATIKEWKITKYQARSVEVQLVITNPLYVSSTKVNYYP